MIYTIDASVESPIMLVNKQIGSDEDGEGIDGALFQQELLQLDSMGKKSIQIWINSVGGVVTDCFSIAMAILKSKTPVDTYCGGIAASSACVLFLCGRKRTMADYAMLMMHDPSNPDGEQTKGLIAMTESLRILTAAKSYLTEDQVAYLMKKTTWMGATECFQNGFCTDIEVTTAQNQKFMPLGNDVAEVTAMWKEGNKILDSVLHSPNINNSSMSKITMKLQLNDAATEDNVIDEIKKIENRAYTAETKVIKMENDQAREIKDITDKHTTELKAATEATNTAKSEVVAAKAEVADLKAKYDAKEKEFNDIKAKYDASEAEKATAIEAQKKTKAEALITEHVKTGRIKNDAKIIERWTNMAVTDFDGTKEMIEGLPLNAKAPMIQTELNATGTADDALRATNVIALAVRNRLKREGKAS